MLENNSLRVSKINENIVHLHFFTGEVSLSDYQQLYYTSSGMKISVLITHEKNFRFSGEAWDFIIESERDFSFLNSIAIVASQLHLRLYARYYSQLTKNVHKTKVFANNEAALIWLNS